MKLSAELSNRDHKGGEMMQKKTYCALDIAKFMSAFLVICIHIGPLLDINETANFVLVQIIARIAVPLFFIISGYLFFAKLDNEREWNDYANVTALKHYVFRLGKLYLIWSIFYLPFNYLLVRGDGLHAMTFLRYLRDFFFTGSYYHLWFLPALMVAVCAVYVLRRYVSLTTTIIISALLYLIGMLGNVYPQMIEELPYIGRAYHYYIQLFVTTRNGIFFGMLFISLGAYFAQGRMVVSRSTLGPFIGFVLSLCALFGECFFLREQGYMHDLASMYLMLVPTVAFLFITLLSIDLKVKELYKTLRVLSLLIYVSHLMFVVVVTALFPTMNALLQYGIVALSSLLFALIIYTLAKHFPIFKHLYA